MNLLRQQSFGGLDFGLDSNLFIFYQILFLNLSPDKTWMLHMELERSKQKSVSSYAGL